MRICKQRRRCKQRRFILCFAIKNDAVHIAQRQESSFFYEYCHLLFKSIRKVLTDLLSSVFGETIVLVTQVAMVDLSECVVYYYDIHSYLPCYSLCAASLVHWKCALFRKPVHVWMGRTALNSTSLNGRRCEHLNVRI